MPADTHQLEIYQRIWSLVLNDVDFRTIAGVVVGPNNQIRIDSGKVTRQKKGAGQDGDLPELALFLGESRDDAHDGEDDENRPTFGTVSGIDCGDPSVVEYDYVGTLTYPTQDFADFFPLLEVLRRNVRGYALRRSGLTYVGNVTMAAEFNREAEWNDSVRPQHSFTITVPVHRNGG